LTFKKGETIRFQCDESLIEARRLVDIVRRLKEIDECQEKRWEEKTKGYRPTGVIPPQALIAQSWTRSPPSCEKSAELRGVALANALKDTCPSGHHYDKVDARGFRVCSQCRKREF
jgi:hypothetical protein